MIRYSSEVVIDRSPRDVFAALLDSSRWDRWAPMRDAGWDDDGPPRVGLRGHFRMAEGPVKDRLDFEIEEFEADRRVVLHIAHPKLEWRAMNTVRPEGGGTRLTYAGELSFRGLMRLMEPLMRGEVERGEAGEALKLKAMLEAEQDAPTTA